MDPVTALGIVGSVVQLVDFGIKVVSKGNQIYHSGDGTSSENHDLEIVTSDLVLLQTNIKQSMGPFDVQSALSEDDQAILNLCEDSQEVAAALLERLNSAKAQGRYRRWKSLRQAVKSVSSKSATDLLARRLFLLRDQLQMRISTGLRDRINLLNVQHCRNYQALDDTSKEILKAIREGREIFSTAVKLSEKAVNERHIQTEDLVVQTGKTILASIEKLIRVWSYSQLKSDVIKRFKPQPIRHPGKNLISQVILKSFVFQTMEQRVETIAEAHAKTFQWIFKNPTTHKKPWDDYCHWLKGQCGTYWISGKAASGKSTLMKYIWSQPEKEYLLLSWAKGSILTVANFFFWHMGTALQKSQAGLIRTLIFQILNEHRSLIETLLPELWSKIAASDQAVFERLHESWHSWSVAELRQTLIRLLNLTSASMKFCFFIDGADEFDGDHADLVSLLVQISSFPHVKVCVSSRPLMLFEHEFENCPKLRLQDLTVDDIYLFINDKLNEHRRMKELRGKEPRLAEALVTEIVQMSSGVFLWVALVTKSLLEGLTNQDSLADLQRRLKELPPELNDLYNHMLRSINPPFYMDQASRLFQLVYHSRRLPSTVELSLADDDDSELAHKASMRWMTPEAAMGRHKAMVARIKSRCAGLLEIQNIGCALTGHESCFTHQVHYLHLTVKEFFEKPEIWNRILQCTNDSLFNAHISLLRSRILLLKAEDCCGYPEMVRREEKLKPDYMVTVEDAMLYALNAEDSSGQAQIRLCDELDRTTQHLLDPNRISVEVKEFVHGKHWSEPTRCYKRDCDHMHHSFLTCAISYGLTLYVKAKLVNRLWEFNQRTCIPLLEYATLRHPIPNFKTVTRLDMISFLFQEGLDPNERAGGKTPWRRVLDFLSANTWSGTDQLWLGICRLFLVHGADPISPVADGPEMGSIPASVFICRTFRHLPSKPLLELQAIMELQKTMAPQVVRVSRKREADGDLGHNDPRRRFSSANFSEDQTASYEARSFNQRRERSDQWSRGGRDVRRRRNWGTDRRREHHQVDQGEIWRLHDPSGASWPLRYEPRARDRDLDPNREVFSNQRDRFRRFESYNIAPLWPRERASRASQALEDPWIRDIDYRASRSFEALQPYEAYLRDRWDLQDFRDYRHPF